MFACKKCSAPVEQGEKFCANCGNPLEEKDFETTVKSEPYTQAEASASCSQCGLSFPRASLIRLKDKEYCNPCLEVLTETSDGNTSGTGSEAIVPDEIRGWNWGAFCLGWIWAIGNQVWIGLLGLIPYLGIIMNIILGVKGSEWAWQNKRWKSVEHFKSVQAIWAYVGIGLITLIIILVLAV